jgi:hypothetical protein
VSGDLYRFCVFCGADCHADEPDHAAECPSTTGVFPVREEDFGPKCVHCGKGAFGPMHCMDCGSELGLGDHYMHREIDPGDPLLGGAAGASISEIICVGCAAKEALT